MVEVRQKGDREVGGGGGGDWQGSGGGGEGREGRFSGNKNVVMTY